MKPRKKSVPVAKYLLSPNFIDSSGNNPQFMLKIASLLTGIVLLLVFQSQAQDLDVPYVPTPSDVVERMLDLADVGTGDYVIDLGSGDGRIVIAAAKRGAVGHGIDLNPERILEARENAESEGVSDRIMFLQEDIFETDFRKASVVTMYLLTSVNRKLRPTLLENLRPGTRVVSHSFDMGDWKPDNFQRYANRNIYFWVIPAKVGENWKWETNGESFTMAAKQEFQEINVQLYIGNRGITTEEASLLGRRINVIALDEENDTRYIFNGRVENNTIEGTAQIHQGDSHHIEEWSTTLNEQ
ncbi:SAM-dependent methyltransferase [Rhodohalobacter sp. 614A]|uniref:SAM-dependent methyltransferase n=1 Tax=Rhodohalobacter sp. 614A TaxID=2908649 RepID=UPI001F27315D|nr:class I SAM-dependent methyltransferase [Rhodohalobacter sp. 614A]